MNSSTLATGACIKLWKWFRPNRNYISFFPFINILTMVVNTKCERNINGSNQQSFFFCKRICVEISFRAELDSLPIISPFGVWMNPAAYSQRTHRKKAYANSKSVTLSKLKLENLITKIVSISFVLCCENIDFLAVVRVLNIHINRTESVLVHPLFPISGQFWTQFAHMNNNNSNPNRQEQ